MGGSVKERDLGIRGYGSAAEIDDGRSWEGQYLEQIVKKNGEADVEGQGPNEGDVDDGDHEEDDREQ